jgi:hypothetical protein
LFGKSDKAMGKQFTKAEAAAKSGASEKTIERSIKAGQLEAQKIHGHLVILEHDLDSFIAQRAKARKTLAGLSSVVGTVLAAIALCAPLWTQSSFGLLGVGGGAPSGGGVTIVRAQHAFSSDTNCSPTCTLTISSTTAGDVGVLSYSDFTGASVHISSVSGGGTWVAAGACEASDTAGGDYTDQAYILSLTGSTTSISVTLSASDAGADLQFNEYHRSSGSWTLDGSCGAVSNPTAANPTNTASMTVGSGNTDVIVAVLEPASNYCSGRAVGGTGWTTPILDVGGTTASAFIDAVQVTSGTYQGTVAASTGTCPGTIAAASWASSALAFK